MVQVIVTDGWRATFPGASVGLLEMRGVSNPADSAALNSRKVALESELRDRFGGMTRAELRDLPVLAAYAAYYRRFDKTYHVQLQLESVALKGKPIPSVAALVEAMFVSELTSQLLTAGHDLDTIVAPITLDAATEPLPYTLANGKDGELRPGDMFMSDAEGVICSILYGQDARTRLTDETRNAFFVVYAPAGIAPALVETHLRDIAANINLFAPDATVAELRIVTAGT